MNYTLELINDAISKGYRYRHKKPCYDEQNVEWRIPTDIHEYEIVDPAAFFIDPKFWIAIEKKRKWKNNKLLMGSYTKEGLPLYQAQRGYMWHMFIDLIEEGKTIEEVCRKITTFRQK